MKNADVAIQLLLAGCLSSRVNFLIKEDPLLYICIIEPQRRAPLEGEKEIQSK